MASQLITRSCELCHSSFTTSAVRIARGWGRFCGKSCAVKFRRGPATDRFWSRVKKTEGCWTWTGAKISGYGDLRVSVTVHQLAHRFSWELHHGPIPAGLHVLHRCDNPPCVRPDHLFLGTNDDNVADSVNKGRAGRKLTADQVLAIREEYRTLGLSQRLLAIKYGVSKTSMEKLLTWKTWGYL